MSSFTFTGKVLPERATLDIHVPFNVVITTPDGQSLSGKMHILANQVSITVKAPSEFDSDLSTLRNYVEESIRAIVDFAGFLYGIGYDYEMISAINNDTGAMTVFGIQLPVTSDDPEVRGARFSELLPCLSKSQYLPLALSDLREAIKSPVDSGVFSFRAAQTIMQAFRKPRESESKGWNRMIKELNLNKGIKQFMGRHAGDRRHGKPIHISWDDRKAMMRRAWVVVDRYFEYLIRGEKALPKSKFLVPKYD